MTRHLRFRWTSALLLVTTLIPCATLAQGPGAPLPTQRIFDAIGVREGAVVCEIGAGDGELSIDAAKIVGVSGLVYTSELGGERMQSLQARIARAGLRQIAVVAGDAVKTNFPDGSCDALFMRNVYHHFADPATMNASIALALKPGGRLAIVDFTPPEREAPCPPDRGKDGMHGVSPETVVREVEEAGFEDVSSEQGDQRWFMVVASKPGGRYRLDGARLLPVRWLAAR